MKIQMYEDQVEEDKDKIKFIKIQMFEGQIDDKDKMKFMKR